MPQIQLPTSPPREGTDVHDLMIAIQQREQALSAAKRDRGLRLDFGRMRRTRRELANQTG